MRLVSVTLGGPGRHSVVTSCVIEVEREQTQEEITVEFSDDQAPALASLEALIAVLNKSLRR